MLAEPRPVVCAASLRGITLAVRRYGLPIHRVWVLVDECVVFEMVVFGVAIRTRGMTRILCGRCLH